LGGTPALVGVLVASNALAQFFAGPIIGRLSDKFGRRPLLILSISGTVASFLLLGLAEPLGDLLAGLAPERLTVAGAALVMCILATVPVAANASPSPAGLTILDLVALPVWATGFFFEAVGDWQLARFLANPANRGNLFNRGLWRYTRHPNYFGEATMWWAHYLVALSVPYGFLTIVSPVLITFLLLRVSGVALLEKSMVESTPGYTEYLETTSSFVPWFPRKGR
jgi:protein-S-isoprenylcysteine O-methyltransferase Ste14